MLCHGLRSESRDLLWKAVARAGRTPRPIAKNLKRAMAAAYGSELLRKLFADLGRLALIGLRQRGSAG